MKFRTKIVSLVLVVLSLFCLTGCEYLYEGGTGGQGGTNVDISGSRTKYTDSLKLALLPSTSSTFDVDGMCFACSCSTHSGKTCGIIYNVLFYRQSYIAFNDLRHLFKR